MKLNARQVDTAKGKDKPYKLANGFGPYLLVMTCPQNEIQRSVSHVGSFTLSITLSPGRRKFRRRLLI